MKIKDAYQKESYEIQIKAPTLYVILIVLFGLSLMILFGDFLSRASASDFMQHLILMIMPLLSIIAIRKGMYKLVANSYFSFITLVFITLRLTDPILGDTTLPLYVVIVGAFLIFSSVFIEKNWILLSLIILFVFGYIFLIIKMQINNAWREEELSMATQIAYTTIAITSINSAILLIRSIFQKVMISVNEKMSKIEQNSEKNRLLVNETLHHLGTAEQLRQEADNTHEISEHILVHSQNLKGDIEQLNIRLETSREALDRVDQSISNLLMISQDQSSQVTQSSAAIEEMVASINSVSQIVQNKSQSVEKLKNKANDSEASILQTKGAFEKSASLLDKIKAMTDIISGIAEQTNLLAMNAAIEAAHAGNSGRGFAVVAAEIRKLAESSSFNAKQIEDTIKEMVNSFEKTGHQLDESSTTFQIIAEEIDNVGSSMLEIARNTEELNSGSQEILKSVSHLNHITHQVVDQGHSVSQSSENVNKDLNQISQISEDTEKISHSSLEESRLLKKSSENMRKLCQGLLEQSIKLNDAISEE